MEEFLKSLEVSRGFCRSCHAGRLEEWGEWMRETLKRHRLFSPGICDNFSLIRSE